jgi:hypothetical protein
MLGMAYKIKGGGWGQYKYVNENILKIKAV